MIPTTLGDSPETFRIKIRIPSLCAVTFVLVTFTFRYRSDRSGTPQFGLIAEDVAAVNPDLVVRDANGGVYTLGYDVLNAMLLNEFLKEHRRVEELKSAMAQQRKDFETAIVQQRKAKRSSSRTVERAGSADREGERAHRNAKSERLTFVENQ